MSLCMGPRPEDFFGPEDWDGVTDPQELSAEVTLRQQAWDEAYRQLPWWQRLRVYFTG